MTNSMIVANILHRPMRTFVSVVAVAIQVTLVLLVVGITTWMRVDSAKRQEGIGADIMFRPPNAQLLWLTGAPMSVKFKEVLERVEGVKVAAPVLIQTTTSGGLSQIFGIDLPSYSALSGGFNYLRGGPFEEALDVLVDDLHARNNKLRVGDQIDVLNHKFRVCGIVEHGKGARVFVPLATLQDLMGAVDKTSVFYIKAKDPNETDAVVQRIKAIPELRDYSVISIKEYLSQITNATIPALNTFIDVMIFIACLIGFLVIYLSMYTTITERTREIGILKSLGASKLFIVDAILREALLLTILGILLGLGFTFLAKRVITTTLPTLSVLITTAWVVRASLLAVLAGVLGGFYPSLRAASQDPIAALSYE
ncbi:MAG: ABC transporter permease [Acidobacteriia bacterium]|nr:ABC transporter permease [Terriglobia bacterium]